VGRQLESQWLAARLDEAVSGAPTLALIEGDAGMGKTRLLRELRPRLERNHGLLWGHAYEHATAPYLPIAEALRSASDQFPQAFSALEKAELDSLQGLTQGAAPPAPAESTQAAPQGQTRLFLAVARLLLAASRDRPLVLVFDDLHWLDQASLDLLTHLVFTMSDRASAAGLPLLVCAAYRSDELPGRASVTLDRWHREQICHSMKLQGLSEREVAMLVREMGYGRPSQQLIDTLMQATVGNPLFVQEAVLYLQGSGALVSRGGSLVTTVPPSDIRLPHELTDAIAQRVADLDANGRAVLEIAVLLGDAFPYAKLQAVAGDRLDVATGVASCVEAGFLRDQGASLSIRHPLVRQVVYSSAPGVRRRELHLRIADVLEHEYTRPTDEQLSEIAHHIQEASSAAEPRRTLDYARLAGDSAMRVFAWGEAARHYEAAVEAAQRIKDFPSIEFARLSKQAAFAYYRNLDSGPCLHHLAQAIPIFERENDLIGLGEALALRTRCSLTQVSVPYGEMVNLAPLEEIASRIEDEAPEVAAELLAVMSQAYWTGRNPDKARQAASRALEIGERTANNSICAMARSSLALNCLQSLELDEAYEHWSKSLEHARAGGDVWAQGWPLARLPLVLTWQGKLAQAELAFREAKRIIEQTQDMTAYSLALAAQVCGDVACGRFSQAEERAGEATRAIQRSRYPWAGPIFLPALASARTAQGDYAEAADALERLTTPGEVFEDPGRSVVSSARIFEALIKACSGDCSDADAYAHRDWSPTRVTEVGTLSTLCATIELCDYISSPPGPGLVEALAAAMTKGVMLTTGWVFLVPRVLGVAAAAYDDFERAEQLFQQAISFAAENGARVEIGRACFDYARMLSKRGAAADSDARTDLLRRAKRIFAEVGARALEARVDEMARPVRPAVLAEPSGRYPDRLTEREVQVLLLVSRGHTNQSIADTLVLSPKTVARHLSNIFDKIGVDNRAAATAYAFEKGLASSRTL
jgi:DNA-binding CsgD family transcriptional regulator